MDPRALASLYRVLSRLAIAGITPHHAAAMLEAEPGRARVAALAVAAAWRRDETLSRGLARAPGVPAHHVATVRAAEAAGRLDEVLAGLAAACEHEAATAARIVGAARGPLVLAFAASILLPAPAFVHGGLGGYLAGALPGLLACAGLVLGVRHLARRWSDAGALARVPVVGGAALALARARGLRVAAVAAGAGLPVTQAFALAATAAGGPAGAELSRVERAVASGRTLREALAGAPDLAHEVATFAAEADATGRLDVALEHAARMLEETAATRMDRAVRLGGVAAFVLVAAWVGWRIVASWPRMAIE